VKRVFVSDCEGPISKNDNAFELTAHFVPNGDKLFTVISRYDDALADVVKRSGYKAGDTLKLILPFLKACGVTDQKMRDFSAKNLILIPNIKETLQHIRSIASAFIVSTSYEHYIHALCEAVSFPPEDTYSTRVNLGEYRVSEEETKTLRQIADEIARMSIAEIPHEAKSLSDLTQENRETVKRLDEIFWKEITCTDCGRMFSEVNPVGGKEKATAIEDIAGRLGASLADIMYVGDSITDEEAFKLVRENSGLTVSFNGNYHAVGSAEIAIMSENSAVTAVIADVFLMHGKQQTLKLVKNWNREALNQSPADDTVLKRLFGSHPKDLPKVKIITSENMETLAKESSEFRKKVRGEAIGRLG
jgi:energy-converting hydrogenase A subunit R